jgi:hypothetical protein
MAQKELEECTFKPNLIKQYDPNNTMNKSRTRGAVDKCTELYMKAKPAYNKRDKTREEFEIESGANEFTFKPNIGES